MRIRGPAVIDQKDATIVIRPDQDGAVDAWLNLFIAARDTAARDTAAPADVRE